MLDMSIKNERCGILMAMARNKSGKTKIAVAKELGVDSKTIYNWETGYRCPTFTQIMDYFNAIGISPNPYLYMYAHPSLIKNVDDYKKNTSNERQQLMQIVINDLTDLEVLELLFLCKGEHGSSRYATLQEMTANLHTSMESRYRIADSVLMNFELDEFKGDLVCKDSVMPDMESLESATNLGKKAIKENRTTYVGLN